MPATSVRFAWPDALVAAWLGALVATLGHGAYVIVRVFLQHRFAWTTRDILWMGPPSYFLYIAPVALVAYTLSRRRPTRERMRRVVAAALATGLFAVLLLSRVIHPVALLLMATGMSLVVAHWVATRASARWRLLRLAAVGLTVACALGAVFVRGRPLMREREALRAAAPSSESDPNVLLVVLDAVRAASMQIYGHDAPNTPVLAELAREGTKFDWAFAPASWSLPSHATLLTGLDARDVRAGWTLALPDEKYTLAEHLSRAGFVNAGFIGNTTFVTWEDNLHQGFTRWNDFGTSLSEMLWTPTFSQTPFVRRLVAPDSTASRWEAFRQFGISLSSEFRHTPVTAGEIVDRTLEWQRRVGDRRFFAVLNFFDAHDPYEAPPEWRGRFGGGEDEESRYDVCIGYIDSELGRLFGELRKRGVLDRTLVIVTADHGELFGEHGMRRHSEDLYLNSIHVPLLVRYPARVPAGLVVDEPVGVDRVPATILDLLGDDSRALPGVTLRAAWEGTADPADQYAVSWIDRAPWGRGPAALGPVTSVVDGTWHWVLNPDGREELYRYREDREELRDLAHDSTYHHTRLALRAIAGRHRLLP